MPFPFIIVSRTVSKPLFFPVLICYFLFILFPHGGQANYKNQVIKIGAIVDVNSRIGKEELTAMKIAAQNFNKDSMNRKVSLYFLDSSRDPQQVASAGECFSFFQLASLGFTRSLTEEYSTLSIPIFPRKNN